MTAKPRAGRERRKVSPRREPFDVVLIVCEGSKTEPVYFKDLCDDLRLSTANVLVLDKGHGCSPSTVVAEALARFRQSKNFDRVFCVFDRDAHADYQQAVDRCRGLKQQYLQSVVCPFVSVTSNPSFEYWIYLHFKDSAAPIVAAGVKSSGAIMLSELRREHPDYAKSSIGLFSSLKARVGQAASRARRINAQGNDNPHTRIVELVAYLAGFRKGRGIQWVDDVLAGLE